MNLQTMITYAKSHVRDFGAKQIPDAFWALAANTAQGELVSLIKQARKDFFVKSTTGTIPVASSPDPSEVTIPSDFAELKDIDCTTSGYEDLGFIWLDRSDPRFHQALINGDSISSGQANVYYDIVGTKIQFAPGLDVALAYRMYYVPVLADMVKPDDEPTGIPADAQDYMVIRMVADALLSLKDPRLDDYLKRLEDHREEIVKNVGARQIRDHQFAVGYMEPEGW